MAVPVPVDFVTGKFQVFEAVMDFGLNFEDRKIKSFKVRISDTVHYDGETAKYTSPKGEEVIGICPSLRSAINVMGWLVLKKNGKVKDVAVKVAKVEAPMPASTGDFDAQKGGNFDTFAIKDRANVFVAKKPDYSVIKETDLTVKTIEFTKKSNVKEKRQNDLSAVGDQVEVRSSVNSSTAMPRQGKFSTNITRADEMGSAGTTPINNIKKLATKEKKPSNTFMVDKSSPVPSEDVTKEDLRKAIKRSDESQDAKVVGKIAKGKITEVQSIDGVTLKHVDSPTEVSLKTKLSSGGDAPISAQEEGKVVGAIKSVEKRDADALEAAKQRAAARKAAAASTQAQVEKERAASGNPNYLSMLPENWVKLHWVKKEQFIKTLTDKAFIEYILSVETLKAVQNACRERLKELG